MMTSSNGNILPRYWPFVWGIHLSPVNCTPGELWGSYCEDLGDNCRCFNGTALYRADNDIALYMSELIQTSPVELILNVALCDMQQVHSGICEIGLFTIQCQLEPPGQTSWRCLWSWWILQPPGRNGFCWRALPLRLGFWTWWWTAPDQRSANTSISDKRLIKSLASGP